MGIHQLNPLLQDKYPKCFKYISWSFFTGKRIAIDIDILTYANGSVYNEEHCNTINFYIANVDDEKRTTAIINSIVITLQSKFINYGITPVVVFSGKAPVEKDIHARTKRTKEMVKAQTKYQEYFELHRPTPGNEDKLDVLIYNKLAKLKAATLRPIKGFDERLVLALNAKGIITLFAIAEAEELCSTLCLEGVVDAVYSTDTDNIVRRCPLLITKIAHRDTGDDGYELTAEVTQYTNELPVSLGLDYAGFVDLCILLGCDYNDGIPKWGKVKCAKEMALHMSIEVLQLAHSTIDFTVLNYVRCREIFNLYHQRSSKDCCRNPDTIDFL